MEQADGGASTPPEEGQTWQVQATEKRLDQSKRGRQEGPGQQGPVHSKAPRQHQAVGFYFSEMHGVWRGFYMGRVLTLTLREMKPLEASDRWGNMV